ncbi:autotransporter outer membrane beta-barrel domain-containing protein [Budvicia diplopodorum]|uniref:autotransporter outer membrane beta-barrel domain-containing protein n=1 Tax=Budvicia diplopodorum TaxID=1119056 RepID=UPI001359CF26|nr:autotransporter outer membrane beta-barrel domain-containing protein [Budvicia diplopodorum]
MNKSYQVIWNSKVGRHAIALATCGLSVVGSLNAYATDYVNITAYAGDSVVLNVGDRVTGPPPYALTGLLHALGVGAKITATGIAVDNTVVGAYGIISSNGALIDLTNTTITSVDLGILAIDNGNVIFTNSSVASSGADTVNLVRVNFSSNGSKIQSSGDHRGLFATESTVNLIDTNVETNGLGANALDINHLSQATLTGGNILTEGDYSTGLLFLGASLNVNGTTILTKGSESTGLTASGDVTILNGGSVTTQGDNATGILSGGQFRANGTSVSVSGNDSRALTTTYGTSDVEHMDIRSTGNATAGSKSAVLASYSANLTIKNSQINSSGIKMGGLELLRDADVHLIDTDIIATGDNAYGISAQRGKVDVSGGTIHSSGTGIQGSNSTVVASNTTILTTGIGAEGVMGATGSNMTLTDVNIQTGGASSNAVDANAANINLNSVMLTTQGEQASGLIAQGNNATINGRSVIVQTAGVDAAGIQISHSASSASTINLQNSLLNSAQSDGMLVSSALGAINLTNSIVTGGNGNVLNAENASQLTLKADSSILNGDLQVSNDSTADVSLRNGSVLKGAAHNVTVLNMDNSQWLMSADSDLRSLNSNSSVISFNQPVLGVFKTLTIGNLSGNGSTFVLNTVLNEGDSNAQSDKIHIIGDATGNHSLVVNNAGGLGALTVGDGIQVVSIDGTSGSKFKLGNTVSAGAYEYQLYQGGSTDANDWYLRTYLPSPTPDPTDYVIAYRPEVAGYIAAPYLNQQYGFDTIGTLHERIGDNVTRGNNDTWARMGGQHRTNDAGRFGYRGGSWFVQFGSDLYQDKTDSGTLVSSGLMVTMGTQSTDTQDRLRSLNPTLSVNTGKVVSDAVSLGGYYTRMAQDNSYLDLVGQGTYYHNKYESDHRANQNGYGAVLSGEVGKPFALGGNMTLEPQAQLMYQYLYLDSFNDGVSNIDNTSSHSGLARGGLRLSYEVTTIKPYVVVDAVQRLGGNTSVGIGDTDVSADFTDGWWQTGAGVSVQLAEDTQMYADAKYLCGFDGGMEGYTGHLGVKVSF